MTNLLVTIVTSVVTALLVFLTQERKLRHEFNLKVENLKTEYQAETVIKQLLKHEDWSLRSFKVIKNKLKGFEDNELRKLLIRSGAICFRDRDGEEKWGLLERNKERL